MSSPTVVTTPSSHASRTGPLRPDGLHVLKAHGTGNDFVVLLDPDDTYPMDPAVVAALCDRRSGLGADGLIRVVAADVEGTDGWFMDHFNADGNQALMCGNGVRVLAHSLIEAGLVDPSAGEIAVLSRSGPRPVRLVAAGYPVYGVEMGPVRVAEDVVAVTVTSADSSTRRLPGVGVDVGNPHVVVDVGPGAALSRVDLARRPAVEPEPVDDVNVELVGDLAQGETLASGQLRMRVHERGVGETRSCGTGAVAAAAAAASRRAGSPKQWTVDVPGGRLRVLLRRREGEGIVSSELSGPAEVVAHAVVDPGWLDRVTR